MVLRRSPSLVEQVKTHLKQRITNAEFDSGRIPSELDLANQLKVSRNTVRDALSRLEMEGVIFRKQGAGTFINEAHHMVKTRLEEIVPYEELIKEHGYTPSINLLSVEEKTAGPAIVQKLNLNGTGRVIEVQKLFLANNKPVIFTRSYIPVHLIKRPYTPGDFLAPTYHFLPNFCQQPLAYFLTDIVPVMAPAWLVEQLELPNPQTALISFEEMGYNDENEPVIKATSYFRDDLLRLRLIRRYAQ